MAESIFMDRRQDPERRRVNPPYGVRNCRREAADRRRPSGGKVFKSWWLNVNYAVAENTDTETKEVL